MIIHYLMYRLYKRNLTGEYYDMPLFYSIVGFCIGFLFPIIFGIIFYIKYLTGYDIGEILIPKNKGRLYFLLTFATPIMLVITIYYTKVLNIKTLYEKYSNQKFWLDKVNWFIVLLIYSVISVTFCAIMSDLT